MRVIKPSINKEEQTKWLLGEALSGVNFKMSQQVQVVSGPVKGKRGQLISILSLSPQPAFHLETEDGEDEHVYQSEIISIDA